jgi:DNA-binding transcriptional MerR regulator
VRSNFYDPHMESHLSIDEVAKRTGLTAHTLRYYERIGLIAPVGRAPGGQRRYAASDLAWIEFLLRLRTTHMPIGKMLEFARLRGAGDPTVPERRRMLEQHLADVLADIEAMQESAASLRAKIGHYRSLERSLASNPTTDGGHADEYQHPKPLRTRPRKTA